MITSILIPIILGYILAWVIEPIYKKMNIKVNKKLSLCIIILIIVLFYALLILTIVPMIINEGENILNIINNTKSIKKYVNIDTKLIITNILKECKKIPSIAMNIFLTNIFGIYILYDFTNINKSILHLLPSRYQDRVASFASRLNREMRLYIKGTLIDTIILFIVSFISFSIFKLKYALVLAILVSITNIIPYIGPYIGGIPALLIAFSDSIRLGIIILIVLVLSQIIESNIVNPIIMSKCTKINSLYIIISLSITGTFFGIFGMLFAVPILILIKVYIESIKTCKL